MPSPAQSFREFEQAGWEDRNVCAHYDAQLGGVTTQSIEALLDAAGVTRGRRVLDVATGAGYIADSAAARGAEAIGVDFSSAQVQLARARYGSVRFEEAAAEALPFAEGDFDAVVCGFGMCHFPDPDAALREAFRVLRPGGRVAFSVWAPPDKTVALGAFYGAIREHGVLDVGLPRGPDFFLFSTTEASARALSNAGFASPSFCHVEQVWRVRDPGEAFQALAEGTVRAAATLRAQAPEAIEAIRGAMRTALDAYRSDAGYAIPMPAALSSAVKPAA